MEEFLSLDCIDPKSLRMEVSPAGDSGDLGLLIRYLEKNLVDRDLTAVTERLRAIKKASPKVQARDLVQALVDYKGVLHNEELVDDLVIFLRYNLKHPSTLDPAARDQLLQLVSTLDTRGRCHLFKSPACPRDFLEGTLNIWPLAIENTSWYDIADLPENAKQRPILKVRFSGLRGAFRFLLNEMERRSWLTFHFLQGDRLERPYAKHKGESEEERAV